MTEPLIPNVTASHSAKPVHVLHAVVVAVHALCCGIPLIAGLVGIAASASMIGAHRYLHGQELKVLALSAILVAVGAYFEWRRRTRRRPSTLFLVSAACLVLNAGIIVSHRAEAAAPAAAAVSR